MATMLGRNQRVEGLVVDSAEQLVAIFLAVEVAEVGAQNPGAQRLAVFEADEALVVDVLELCVPEAGGGALVVEGICLLYTSPSPRD